MGRSKVKQHIKINIKNITLRGNGKNKVPSLKAKKTQKTSEKFEKISNKNLNLQLNNKVERKQVTREKKIEIIDSTDEEDCVVVENSNEIINIKEDNDNTVYNNNEINPVDSFFYDIKATQYIENGNVPVYFKLNLPKNLNLNADEIVIDSITKENIEGTEIEHLNLDADEIRIHNIIKEKIEAIENGQLENENNVTANTNSIMLSGQVINADDSESIITISDSEEYGELVAKRPIIIDGSNVAFSHSPQHEFSAKGLEICINYFKELGHEVKAVIPRYRLCKNKSTDYKLMNQLNENGNIVLTPCKTLEDGRKCSSYDDRLVLELASKLEGAVISNDNYLDLCSENPEFKEIIDNRVVGFVWCNDIFLIPEDPYGYTGPYLKDILYF